MKMYYIRYYRTICERRRQRQSLRTNEFERAFYIRDYHVYKDMEGRCW